MTQPVSVNIFGACVSRDIFPKNSPYDIRQYVSFSSPMSVFSPKGPRTLTDDDLSELSWGSDFSKRCLLLDHNKTGMDYLAERPSDWLILDFADIRLPLIRYGDGQVLTETNLTLRNKPQFKKLFGKYQTEPMMSVENYYSCIDQLRETVLQLYPADRIILHQYYMVEDYIDKNGNLTPFRNQEHIQTVNMVLKELYRYFREKCPSCHIIEMPDYLTGTEKHIWGTHPMHYTKLYYEYAFQAVTHIVEYRTPVPEELRLQYSLRALKQKNEAQQKQLLLENKNYQTDCQKLACYAKSIQNLYQHHDTILQKAKEFCEEHGIRHAAFWGDFIITKSLIPLLREAGVTPDYIICNWNHHTLDKVIRTTDPYPSTDAIFVCDILKYENRSKYIHSRCDIPVYSVGEIIPLIYQ